MIQYRDSEAAAGSLARIEHGISVHGLPEAPSASLLDIFLRHRWLFLAVFFCITGLGALYIFGSHKKYASKMELLVQNDRGEANISPSRVEAPAVVHEVTEEQLNSEAELLQSADVLDEVVDPGWSRIPAQQRPATELNQHEQKVSALRKALAVAAVRKSHLLSVEITTRNPYVATDQLNRLLDAFLQEKRRISHPNGAAQMFAQQADLYKRQWSDAQQQLSHFQEAKQLVSVNDQEQLIEKQVLDLDTQLRDTDVAITEAQHKITGDKVQLASVPKRRPTRETSIPATGSIDQMHSKLNELTLQRTELLTKYRADDRLVKQVDQEIQEVQSALNDSKSLYSAENSSDVNPTWQMAEQDLSESSAKLSGLLGKRKALQDQVSNLQQTLSSTEQSTSQFNLLQHKTAELEANYQLYAQKRDEAAMAEVMDEHQLLNVAVVQTPTFSLGPVRPRPVTDGVLTVMTALFLASFAVFLAHNARHTIANEDELQAISGLPTLASVPTRKHLRETTFP